MTKGVCFTDFETSCQKVLLFLKPKIIYQYGMCLKIKMSICLLLLIASLKEYTRNLFSTICLFVISAGEKIAGIEYGPESLQGMRDNLDRILQFMAGKRIRMHHITSKEILEGNLKAVMRLILALAAHYKPQSVRHHDASYENLENKPQQQPQPQQQQQQQQQQQLPSKDASQSTKIEGKLEQ